MRVGGWKPTADTTNDWRRLWGGSWIPRRIIMQMSHIIARRVTYSSASRSEASKSGQPTYISFRWWAPCWLRGHTSKKSSTFCITWLHSLYCSQSSKSWPSYHICYFVSSQHNRYAYVVKCSLDTKLHNSGTGPLQTPMDKCSRLTRSRSNP